MKLTEEQLTELLKEFYDMARSLTSILSRVLRVIQELEAERAEIRKVKE